MNSQEEVIAILNTIVKIKVQPSKISGVGVFAMRDIQKGTKLYANVFPQSYRIPYSSFFKLFPIVHEYIKEKWPQVVNDLPFMWPDTFFQGYMNHSNLPNYDAVNDVALEDIDEGDEITEDYRKIQGWEIAYPWLKELSTENKAKTKARKVV